MHAYGGLYLDLDADCLRNAEEGLAGFNLVLQRERGPASVGTAAMASVPRLPLVSVLRQNLARHKLTRVSQQTQQVEGIGSASQYERDANLAAFGCRKAHRSKPFQVLTTC